MATPAAGGKAAMAGAGEEKREEEKEEESMTLTMKKCPRTDLRRASRGGVGEGLLLVLAWLSGLVVAAARGRGRRTGARGAGATTRASPDGAQDGGSGSRVAARRGTKAWLRKGRRRRVTGVRLLRVMLTRACCFCVKFACVDCGTGRACGWGQGQDEV